MAAAWPLSTLAQPRAMPLIGFLRSADEVGSGHLVAAFEAGLQQAGFVQGRNLVIEYRWAEGHIDRLPALTRDLVNRGAVAIVANSVAAQAALTVTKTVPIVFVTGSDPVGDGLVSSLSRPGGNVTGVIFTVGELTAKRIGLLREIVPNAGLIAVLQDANAPGGLAQAKGVEEARRTRGLRIQTVKVTSEQEFDGAFATVKQMRARALVLGGGPLFLGHR